MSVLNYLTSSQITANSPSREYGTFKKPIRTMPPRPPAISKDKDGNITDTPEVAKAKEAALKAHGKLVAADLRRSGRHAKRTGPQAKEPKPQYVLTPEQKEKSRLYQAQLLKDKWKQNKLNRTERNSFKGPIVRTARPGSSRFNRSSSGYGNTAHSV